jgi:hypothetical protein
MLPSACLKRMEALDGCDPECLLFCCSGFAFVSPAQAPGAQPSPAIQRCDVDGLVCYHRVYVASRSRVLRFAYTIMLHMGSGKSKVNRHRHTPVAFIMKRDMLIAHGQCPASMSVSV